MRRLTLAILSSVTVSFSTLVSDPSLGQSACPPDTFRGADERALVRCLTELQSQISKLKESQRAPFIAGKWSNGEIETQTSGSNLTSQILGDRGVRIRFERQNFKAAPIVILSTSGSTIATVERVTSGYVDISNTILRSGIANGGNTTNDPFWFLIIDPQ